MVSLHGSVLLQLLDFQIPALISHLKDLLNLDVLISPDFSIFRYLIG